MTFSDFKFCIEKLQIKLTNEEIHSLYDYIDCNADGKIEFKEFCLLSQDQKTRNELKDSHSKIPSIT